MLEKETNIIEFNITFVVILCTAFITMGVFSILKFPFYQLANFILFSVVCFFTIIFVYENIIYKQEKNKGDKK